MTNMSVGERVTVMVRSTVQEPGAAAPGEHSVQTDAAAGLGRIEAAVDTARSGTPAAPDSAQFLVALALLRQMREQLAGWEPELIDAARASGASWAQLAPALGVASRQAAERRALRLRPGADQAVTTGDQRVTAERDRRAGIRAVDAYARDHSADLRVLAAQMGGLTGLPQAADAPLAALHEALGGADAAALLAPLLDARAHLGYGHEQLAARIDAISGAAESARADAQEARRR
jgi:hypothetical protein